MEYKDFRRFFMVKIRLQGLLGIALALTRHHPQRINMLL